MEEHMSDQHFQGDGSSAPRTTQSGNLRDTATQTFSQIADMAQDAGEKAKRAASDTASSVTDSVKELLDQQLGSGATMAGQFAKSMRLAANDLDREAPALGGFVHSFADTMDGYAEGMEGQTVEQLARSASDFTRRQPALVFGLAALAGFFVFRTFKNAKSVAPPLQPIHGDYGEGRNNG
jgi:hypothetical protein